MSSAFIDFDKLMEQYDFYNEFTVHDLRYLKKEYLPFVEAIPVEWIKKWCNKEHNRKSLEERLLKRYGVITMLEDWEKENDGK